MELKVNAFFKKQDFNEYLRRKFIYPAVNMTLRRQNNAIVTFVRGVYVLSNF